MVLLGVVIRGTERGFLGCCDHLGPRSNFLENLRIGESGMEIHQKIETPYFIARFTPCHCYVEPIMSAPNFLRESERMIWKIIKDRCPVCDKKLIR